MSKEIDKEVIDNYRLALTQKYNAVCLDIDGTITEKGKKTIDSRIIPVIADLLKRHIPIVFITGRGETGLEDFKRDLFPTLIHDYGLGKDHLRKIYVLVNDGARLFRSDPSRDDEYLTQCEYISKEEAFRQLDELKERLERAFSTSSYKNYYDISYSKDSVTGRIINIRLNIKTDNEKISDEVYKVIKMSLRLDSRLLNITEGNYQGRKVLQIGTSQKASAVKKAEQIIGIPRNSMLLIGDRGDERGNDFSMLDSEQGFSVQETSRFKNRCFPIFDDDNNLLTGVDATIYLLKKAKILPTICLEKIDKGTYRKQYAEIERRINRGRKRAYDSVNWKFNAIFNVNNGFKDIFDEQSGSVMIPMYEWELIDDDNPLKQFFSMTDADGRYNNMLKDDMNILLRGSKNYYYLLNYRHSIPDEQGNFKDFTSQEDALGWIVNYRLYFNRLGETLSNPIDYNDPINKRLILGALDNLRNAALVCLNSALNRDYDPLKCSIVNLEALDKDSHMRKIYELLLKVHSLMINICSEKDFQISPVEIQSMCECLNGEILVEEYMRTLMDDEERDYSKTYRAYRELDSFAEDYVTASYVYDKTDNPGLGICGISYGGIELPILYKSLFNNCKDVLLFKFPDDIGDYRNKHSVEIRKFSLPDEKINTVGVDGDSFYIISDDNILTAKTIQLAINIFYDLGLMVNKVLVVRYPSINRFQQMTSRNHGAAAFGSFFNYIQGLLFPSPYSYRDNNSQSQYLDSLGVFDLNREKILRCLYKNHDFGEETEVAYVKKKSML